MSIMFVFSQKKNFRECFSIVFHVFHIRRQLFVLIIDIVFQILIDSNYNVVECNNIKIESMKFSLLFNSIMNLDVIFLFFFENEKSFIIDIILNNDKKRIKQRIN